MILFGYVFVFIGGFCIYPFIEEPAEHFDCLIALLTHVAIGALLTVFLGWPALLLTSRSCLHLGRHRLLPVLRQAQLS